MNGNNNVPAKKTRGIKQRKFNVIDFLLIVIALLVVAALVYFFLPSTVIKTITADKSEEIQYSIEILGVDEQFLDNINEDDVVLDSVTKSNIGTVTAIDYGILHTQLKYDEENQVGVLSPVAGKYNVIVTITATAQFEDGVGYTVNGTRIAVGERINARFPNYVCESYCISIPLN